LERMPKDEVPGAQDSRPSEILSGVVGIALVTSALAMLWFVFIVGGRTFALDSLEAQAFQRQKDIALIVIPLATSAVGYFLGLKPGKDALKTARNDAASSKQRERKAEQKAVAAGGVAAKSAGLLEAASQMAVTQQADSEDLGKMGGPNVGGNDDFALWLHGQAEKLQQEVDALLRPEPGASG
jgi:hypothetical protein